MSSFPSVMLATAAATAAFHTLIPDHWLPFVLVGRVRRWSAGLTALVSGVSALVHTALSIALGLAGLAIGEGSAHLLGERLERASAVLLIVFGTTYAIWAWRKGGHFHPGGALLHRAGERQCDGSEEAVNPEHLHYHADEGWIVARAGKSAWSLALIVGLNPCVLVLPIMVATAAQGAATVALVTAAYSLTTTVLMVGLSVAGVVGARRIPVPAASRYMEAASGALIAAAGVVFFLLTP